MFKLLAAIPFIVVGILIGWSLAKLAGPHRAGVLRCIIAGVCGSFLGLLLADIADLRLFDSIANALLFASLGSVALILLSLLILPKPTLPD